MQKLADMTFDDGLSLVVAVREKRANIPGLEDMLAMLKSIPGQVKDRWQAANPDPKAREALEASIMRALTGGAIGAGAGGLAGAASSLGQPRGRRTPVSRALTGAIVGGVGGGLGSLALDAGNSKELQQAGDVVANPLAMSLTPEEQAAQAAGSSQSPSQPPLSGIPGAIAGGVGGGAAGMAAGHIPTQTNAGALKSVLSGGAGKERLLAKKQTKVDTETLENMQRMYNQGATPQQMLSHGSVSPEVKKLMDEIGLSEKSLADIRRAPDTAPGFRHWLQQQMESRLQGERSQLQTLDPHDFRSLDLTPRAAKSLATSSKFRLRNAPGGSLLAPGGAIGGAVGVPLLSRYFNNAFNPTLAADAAKRHFERMQQGTTDTLPLGIW
jgi:hypothetical protein